MEKSIPQGQFSQAFALLGDGSRAGQLFDLLNPIGQSDTEEKAAVYRVEPYVICADVCSVPPHVRRGGWTWYTGSAAWMYRLAVEAILGVRKIGDSLRSDPAIPNYWDGFEVTYRHGKATYHLRVRNPDHISTHVRQVQLDGKPLSEVSVPLIDDGQDHWIEATM